jgi:hypothetical protein
MIAMREAKHGKEEIGEGFIDTCEMSMSIRNVSGVMDTVVGEQASIKHRLTAVEDSLVQIHSKLDAVHRAVTSTSC